MRRAPAVTAGSAGFALVRAPVPTGGSAEHTMRACRARRSGSRLQGHGVRLLPGPDLGLAPPSGATNGHQVRLEFPELPFQLPLLHARQAMLIKGAVVAACQGAALGLPSLATTEAPRWPLLTDQALP